MRKTIAVGMLVMWAVAACSKAGVSTAVPPPAGTSGAAEGTPNGAATPTPAATPAGAKNYQPGDTVTVQKDGKDWAKITVAEVKSTDSYKGTYSTDTPKIAGDVFLSAKVTYEALADGVDYNALDWNIYCANVSVSNMAFVLNGPQPDLSAGNLPKGRIVTGYVVYEVPPKGEVDMTYVMNMFDTTPVFQVVIRPS